jgi:transcriptional regulator NrdR family protein
MATDTGTKTAVSTLFVTKRNGAKERFNSNKILKAVKAAFKATNTFVTDDDLKVITQSVVDLLKAEDVKTLSINKIQDTVEHVLVTYNEKVAKAYIIYRNERDKIRQNRKKFNLAELSEYIHIAKYAKYLPDKLRRETYSETVDRRVNMDLEDFPHLAEEIRWAAPFMYDKKVLPSMRSYQFGGLPIQLENLRQYNCSFTYIDRPEVFSQSFYALLCGTGVGYSVQKHHVDKLPPISFFDNSEHIVHHVIEDSIAGWAEAAKVLIDSAIKGYWVEFAYNKIRPKGAPLKTSGGKAPGYKPLKKALEVVRSILLEAEGRKLRPIEAHRIMCILAQAVLSGGIRRSSLIALFSFDDLEMLTCKIGKWYIKHPEYAMANNSAVLVRDKTTKEQFKYILDLAATNYGEPGFFFTNSYEVGCNPCQPAWATVLTPNGLSTIGEINVGDRIWSESGWTSVVKKWSTGVNKVYRCHTEVGEFVGTDGHRIVSNKNKVPLQFAKNIDGLVGPITAAELDADIAARGAVFGVSICEKTETDSAVAVQKKVDLTSIPRDAKSLRSFLHGLFAAVGVVSEYDVYIESDNIPVLSQLQIALSSIGVMSILDTNGKLSINSPDSLNVFLDNVLFKLSDIYSSVCDMLKQNNSATHSDKSLAYDILQKAQVSEEETFDITVDNATHTYWSGGLNVSNCAEINFYSYLHIDDTTLPLIKEWCSENNQPMPDVKVGEIYSGFGLCNLCEINAATVTDLDDFLSRCKAAAIIGTIQAARTKLPYLGWVTGTIAKRDALLGVSMTGMLANGAKCTNPDWQKAGADVINSTNKEIAKKLGIRPGARNTCIKPSGTSSLELGIMETGIHPAHSRRFIRRITANKMEACYQYFKSLNPHMCVDKSDTDATIMFPVEVSPDTLIKSDLSAIDHLEIIKKSYLNWVVPGSGHDGTDITHNVSNTVMIKADETATVLEYLWDNRYSFAAVSFIPDDGDKKYAFAPFESVKTLSEEIFWNDLISNFKPVDYQQMIEIEDTTDRQGEAACVGGACSIL